MGRHADQFCWDKVDKLPNDRWRCKYCKEEFSGAASRIRIHLSGEGTDIGSCEVVPSHVREEALKRATKKRRRNSSSREENDGISVANRTGVAAISVANNLEMETAFQVPNSNGDLSSNNNKGSEVMYTTDVLVKFFMSQNLPVDVFKNPHFRNFLRRAAQHGFPPCLFRDDLVEIQRSVSNFEHEVNEYMLMVKDSWKTTGCTLIPYNLNVGRGNLSNSKTNTDVYGFYSPKGFIFVEGRQLDFSQGVENGFKNHVLNLPIENVTHQILHENHPWCEFSQYYFDEIDRAIIPCVRETIERSWMRICNETGWVDNLIRKSEKLYHYIINSPNLHQFEGQRKLMVEKDAAAAYSSSFTRLASIMRLEDGIKECTSDLETLMELGVEEIIDNIEFWCDGKELLKALTPLMRIIDLMDTLVPTAGYLQVAINKAKRRLESYEEWEASKYQMIWRSLYCVTRVLKIQQQSLICAYLSPDYDWERDELCSKSLFPNELKKATRLIDIEGQEEKLDAEIKGYRDNNPFANLSSSELEQNHPVELWNKYGNGFPLLKECAIKVLSQPLTCMCNQLKKHIKHFEGEDNFILRLNYHMMQEFSKFGDRIYKPLDSLHYYSDEDEVPASILNQISLKEMVEGPYIDQIPAWMYEFIAKSSDVIADGNCGYRAIAESLGFGQDNWRKVRGKLHKELNSRPNIYEPTFLLDDVTVATISNALSYYGSGNAPRENWLEVTNMGLLVATTFQAIFVVLSPTINHTYLPLFLNPGFSLFSLPEIVICHNSEHFHFTPLSLTKNAPLPPVYQVWFSHHDDKIRTGDIDDFIKERLNPYLTLAERHNGEMLPTEIIDYID